MARSPLNPNLDQLNEGLRLYTNHLSGQDFFTSPARYLAVERRGEEVSTQSMSAYGAKIFARAIAAYHGEWRMGEVVRSSCQVKKATDGRGRVYAYVFTAGVVVVAFPCPRDWGGDEIFGKCR